MGHAEGQTPDSLKAINNIQSLSPVTTDPSDFSNKIVARCIELVSKKLIDMNHPLKDELIQQGCQDAQDAFSKNDLQAYEPIIAVQTEDSHTDSCEGLLCGITAMFSWLFNH